MFCRAGKIVDVFLPWNPSSGKIRGFAFVRFGSLLEADRAISLAVGRSWGGRKILVNMAKFQASRHEVEEDRGEPPCIVQTCSNVVCGGDIVVENAWLRKARTSKGAVGWVIDEGKEKGVRVTSWVVEEKQALVYSLVGFLKESKGGISEAEHLVKKAWGRKIIRFRRLDEQTVLM